MQYRLFAYHWFRYRQRVEAREQSGHLRDTGLYGPGSDVPLESRCGRRLFRRWRHGLRMHVRKGKYLYTINNVRGPTSERAVKKSEITFLPNKYKSREMKFPRAGRSRQRTSSTRWSRESLRIVSAWMAQMRSRIIPGSRIFLGKTSGTGRYRHRLSRLKRITSIKRISMRTGRTRRTKNSSRIF